MVVYSNPLSPLLPSLVLVAVDFTAAVSVDSGGAIEVIVVVKAIADVASKLMSLGSHPINVCLLFAGEFPDDESLRKNNTGPSDDPCA